VHDIDWSCPADLEPYAKAHKIEVKEIDNLSHIICGTYILSCVSTAVEHCLSGAFGKKGKSKYIEEAVISKALEECEMTEDEIAEKEIKKAILAESMWMIKAKCDGLPETVIKE